MANRERAKGLAGEREAAALYRDAGFEVRGLEDSGDWLAFGYGSTHHVEVKRHEVARVWAWQAQALLEAPAGTFPVVTFRRSRAPWWSMAPTVPLLASIAAAASSGLVLAPERRRLVEAADEARRALAAAGVRPDIADNLRDALEPFAAVLA
jgi:hypothetical protein